MFYIFYFKVSIKTFKPVSHTLSKISDKRNEQHFFKFENVVHLPCTHSIDPVCVSIMCM